jgi:hypothetical protein
MYSANAAPELSYFKEQDLRVKIRSAFSYQSQVALLFGDKANLSQFLQGYGLRNDPQRFSEQFWSFES